MLSSAGKGTIQEVKILIIGAGPTGLGAAKRLCDVNSGQRDQVSWLIVDECDGVGGLASTDTTPEGFLFDVGGHVIFSHYACFDRVLKEALPKEDDWLHHQRISYIRCHNTNNIARLPIAIWAKCIHGLVKAFIRSMVTRSKPADFDEWIVRNTGTGIADIFMRPYNYKVWGVPTKLLQCKWLGERVAAPDLRCILTNIMKRQETRKWGPNATFRFPAHGDKIQLKYKVIRIDPQEKVAYLEDGRKVRYKHLISTMNVDQLVSILPDVPNNVQNAAEGLVYSTTHVIGLGLRGTPREISKMCWMYFPEDNAPFYRSTVFSNYSPNLVPHASVKLRTVRRADSQPCNTTTYAAGPYWSLMLEISESGCKPVNKDTLVSDVIQGCINTGLVKESDEIVSLYFRSFHHCYPTPTLNRDECLATILPYLRDKLDIWSRGRFGAWKYEVANQDHSFMQGVEAVDNTLFGKPEVTLGTL
ncbi:hypothetical protein AMATHDRAFT_82802 [Amanita thiersii Skay4041]|uniref:Amine oxidase domain-containing protein n=1 Tax=Amanita thiersii Skay4041 TaxID=703135 RepID=A0A2A9NDI1_9AGAR|nr:hypothetical protein AMATHDRAFT_82802 [Amanita thiersii Skay4041]